MPTILLAARPAPAKVRPASNADLVVTVAFLLAIPVLPLVALGWAAIAAVKAVRRRRAR
jgi:uncharacterized membrane protein